MVNLIEVTTKNSLVIQLALNFTMDMHSKFSNRTHYSVLQDTVLQDTVVSFSDI